MKHAQGWNDDAPSIIDQVAVGTLSTQLLSKRDPIQPGTRPNDEELAWTWIERNDAQNYVVLGDPAIRLRVDLLRR